CFRRQLSEAQIRGMERLRAAFVGLGARNNPRLLNRRCAVWLKLATDPMSSHRSQAPSISGRGASRHGTRVDHRDDMLVSDAKQLVEAVAAAYQGARLGLCQPRIPQSRQADIGSQ